MLDKNALSQLQSLKQEIQASIPRYEGRVRATGGRFGFVVTDDNQQFYLSAEEMEKVLPGDRIAVRIETSTDDKQQAIIESLIETTLNDFCGTYVIRGKGHFVEADHPALNRWIFVPPKQRQQCQEGSLVKAHLSQHPYPHGKAQASVDINMGTAADNGIEARFMCEKWQLPTEFPADCLEQANQLVSTGIESLLASRADLTALPLVTIDSPSTRDLDDALCASITDSGWTLHVAIADPAALIEPGSALDRESLKRSTSVYFANLTIPMLPAVLSEQLASLVPGQQRLALVAEIQVSSDGQATLTGLQQAVISSRAKLGYTQVAEFMADPQQGEIPAGLHDSLKALADCAAALGRYRREHYLAVDERPDYRLQLDDQGKVRDILRLDRNDAQKLVEECMLVCNRLSADWMAERGAGIYVEHAGIRSERMGDVAALLREQLALSGKPKIKTVEDYRNLVKQAEAADSPWPLRDIINRQLERSYLTSTANPHMGLGFEHYTTMTSPLRKYNDLLVHRLLAQMLSAQEVALPTPETLQAVQDQQLKVRAASGQADTWMKLGWLQSRDSQEVYDAVIQQANANSITVRLEAWGIDGQIDRRKAGNQWNFDSKTLSHSNGSQTLGISQNVRVRVQEINPQKRELRLQLIES